MTMYHKLGVVSATLVASNVYPRVKLLKGVSLQDKGITTPKISIPSKTHLRETFSL